MAGAGGWIHGEELAGGRVINVQLLGIMSSASVLGGPRPAAAVGREGGRTRGDVTTWGSPPELHPGRSPHPPGFARTWLSSVSGGSPLGTSPHEAPVPPWLCRDGVFPRQGCTATPLPAAAGGPSPAGSIPSRMEHPSPAGLLLLPMAHPARRPRSRAWSRRRVKVSIPCAIPPGESGAGAAAVQRRAPAAALGVPGGSRDPLCHPVPSSELAKA